MKESKRALFAFQPSDCAAAQQWLTELYEEGWELERLSRFLFWPARFIPRTRDGLRYCVDLNTNSHILDPYIAPDAYGQLVADSGWELVGSCGGLNVYRSKPGMDPAPIQTDPALERKRIWRLTVLPELIGLAALVLLLAVPFLLAARLGLRPAFPLRLLESNWELLGVPSLLLLLGWYPYQAFRALFLWWRAPGAASAPDVPKARRRAWLSAAAQVLYLYFCVVLSLTRLLLPEGLPLSPHEISAYPLLQAEELGLADAVRFEAYRSSSVFLEKVEVDEWFSEGSLEQTRYDCRFTWVAGLVVDGTLENYRYIGAPVPVELGFDGSWREGRTLLIREGNVVLLLYGSPDWTDPAVLELVRGRLEPEPSR